MESSIRSTLDRVTAGLVSPVRDGKSVSPTIDHERCLAFHMHRDGGLIFDGRTRLLYGLNRAGSLCWASLASGGGPEQIQAGLLAEFAVSREVARLWQEECFDTFERLGFFAAARDSGAHATVHGSSRHDDDPALIPPAAPPAEPIVRFHGTLLDLEFSLELDSNETDGLAAMLRPLIEETARRTADARLYACFRVSALGGRFDIRRDGVVEARGISHAELATAIESLLVTAAIRATPHLLALHAGVVAPRWSGAACGDRAILLAGASGRGKSTLTMALVHAGWRYGGDDLCLLTRAGELRPIPLDPCVKQGAWEIVAECFPAITDAPTIDRFGRAARFAPVVGPRLDRGRAAAVVLPFYAPQGGTSLSPVEPAVGLELLLQECPTVSRDFAENDIVRMADWHDGLAYWALPFDDVRSAVACLDAAFGRRAETEELPGKR